MRATIKKLNEHILSKTPYFNIIKGKGYFYFYLSNHGEKYLPQIHWEPPASIYTFALHQCSLDKWQEMIDGSLNEWEKERKEQDMLGRTKNERGIKMTKFQLVYNGNKCLPLCNTREEADRFKQKAADQWPEMKVVIKEINQEAKAGE